MEYNNLPVYLLDISDNENDDIEVDFVALVDNPAIKRNFLSFSNQQVQQRFSLIEERRIISGPLMLADTPIYRKDKVRGEFYVMFEKDVIERIVQRFFKKGYQHNVNLMHDEGYAVEGLTMFESFITDSGRGILPMKGFDDAPEGSWFGSFKVDNEEVWNMIKQDKFKGFSVEGGFEMYKPKTEAFADQIIQILADAGF